MMPVVTIYTPIVVYEIACQDVHPHLPKDKQTATCQKGQNQFTSFMVHPACERKISMCENINAFSYILLLIFLLLLLIFLLLIIFYLFSCYLLFFTYFSVTYYYYLCNLRSSFGSWQRRQQGSQFSPSPMFSEGCLHPSWLAKVYCDTHTTGCWNDGWNLVWGAWTSKFEELGQNCPW